MISTDTQSAIYDLFYGEVIIRVTGNFSDTPVSIYVDKPLNPYVSADRSVSSEYEVYSPGLLRFVGNSCSLKTE